MFLKELSYLFELVFYQNTESFFRWSSTLPCLLIDYYDVCIRVSPYRSACIRCQVLCDARKIE